AALAGGASGRLRLRPQPREMGCARRGLGRGRLALASCGLAAWLWSGAPAGAFAPLAGPRAPAGAHAERVTVHAAKKAAAKQPIEAGDTVYIRVHTGSKDKDHALTIEKKGGGTIESGDQGEYLDGNPLDRAPDGEVKSRWRDEGEWQVLTIEK
ncbi:unnamed protein product, partial [Prorocentrum cordatum]